MEQPFPHADSVYVFSITGRGTVVTGAGHHHLGALGSDTAPVTSVVRK